MNRRRKGWPDDYPLNECLCILMKCCVAVNDSFGKKNNSAEDTKMNEEKVRSYEARADSSMCQTGVKKFLF
jgi:hypothetical protein